MRARGTHRPAIRRLTLRERDPPGTPAASSSRAVPGPIAAMRTPVSARRVEDVRALSAAERVRAHRSRDVEHHPGVLRQVGKLDGDRLRAGSSAARATSAPSASKPVPQAHWPVSRGPASPPPFVRRADATSNHDRSRPANRSDPRFALGASMPAVAMVANVARIVRCSARVPPSAPRRQGWSAPPTRRDQAIGDLGKVPGLPIRITKRATGAGAEPHPNRCPSSPSPGSS